MLVELGFWPALTFDHVNLLSEIVTKDKQQMLQTG